MKEQLLSRLQALQADCLKVLPSLKSLQEIQNFKVSFLGRKGELKSILNQLGALNNEDRPIVGQAANKIKQEIEQATEELTLSLAGSEKGGSQIDITLPGFRPHFGKSHPISQTLQEISELFYSMGFSIEEGPDIETDYYNFEALNFPPDHPAREMQDTFYISSSANEKLLLRTHTSPVQIRAMQRDRPPLYMICPGAVYRHDDDLTHSPMFHQVEGLAVDTAITFGDLKGVLTFVCKELFGKEYQVRFRPSFFPFVEPGAEVDISCIFCKGGGCRVCSQTGWLEILGAGMVHPNVLQEVGIDPKKYSGFAFGMGVERVAMLKYRINDIRFFYESDLRFLEQF